MFQVETEREVAMCVGAWVNERTVFFRNIPQNIFPRIFGTTFNFFSVFFIPRAQVETEREVEERRRRHT